MDVPYLNVRHAYLPWLRVRVHLSRLQHLERRWTELLLAHRASSPSSGSVRLVPVRPRSRSERRSLRTFLPPAPSVFAFDVVLFDPVRCTTDRRVLHPPRSSFASQ